MSGITGQRKLLTQKKQKNAPPDDSFAGVPQKHMITNEASHEEPTNEIQSHHLDVSRMPKDKTDDGRIETVGSTKPQITKRNSSQLAGGASKGADSRISKSSNKDLKNVITDGNKISKTVSKNPSKHLVNQSINAQTPMIDGAVKDQRTNSGLDVMTQNLHGSPDV